MPGVTLFMTAIDPADSREEDLEARHARAQEARRHDSETRAEVVARAPGLRLGWTGPADYPITRVEGADSTSLVEGWITSRDPDAVRRRVSELAALLLGDSDADTADAVRRFQEEMHGDWVVACMHRDGSRAAVFTDSLGRLPIYAHADEESLVVSREPGFAAAVRGGMEPDRLGVAQLVWLGYPIGERSLLKGVSALPTGALLRAQRAGASLRVDIRSLYELDLSPRQVGDRGPAAERLVAHFVEGCREISRHPRFAPGVLSLSGGQDSRAVAAGMARVEAPLVAVTQHEPRAAADEAMALRVAEVLGISCDPIPVPTAGIDLRRRLARSGDGLNTVRAARLLPYVEEIKRRFGGTACYLTGEGGDKVLPDLARVGGGAGIEDLAAAIERHNARLDAAVVERWLGLESGRLRDSLRERVSAYPESDAGDRYAHFLVAERARRRLFEAEDRVRTSLWPATPFYHLPFFEEAIAIPRSVKRDYRLFARFQELLSPELSALPDASTPWPIGSRRFRWRRRLAGSLSLAPPALRRAVSRARGGSEARFDDAERAILRAISEGAGALSSALDPDAIERLLAQGFDPETADTVWTVALWLEQGGASGFRDGS
jgi:asparagine synthase (glutamine-hydrolysing)